jgi:hypothetical protein
MKHLVFDWKCRMGHWHALLECLMEWKSILPFWSLQWQSLGIMLLLFLNISKANAQSLPGAALHFDGANDLIEIHSIPNLLLSSFTIEFWARHELSGTDSMVFCQNQSTGQTLQIRLLSNNSLEFEMFGNTLSYQGAPDNNWHHWACTFDKATNFKRIYRDSVPVDSSASGNSTGIGNFTFTFVGGVPTTASYFKGNLDEVRIWQRALCHAEITSYMSCEIPASEMNLLANYHFNQGMSPDTNFSVDTLVDASGNGHSGKLYNFALDSTASNWISSGGVFSGDSCSHLPPTINCSGNQAVNLAPAGMCNTYLTIPSPSTNCVGTSDWVALDFDGINDYVTIPDHNALGLAQNFTLSLWFKSGAPNQYQTSLFSKGATGYAIRYQYAYDSVEFYPGSVFARSRMKLPDFGWHHIAYTYDGNNFKGFLDGILKINVGASIVLPQNSDALVIGSSTSSSGFVDGAMDELNIWNKALTKDELRSNMIRDLKAQPGLMAVYHFNEGRPGLMNNLINIVSDGSSTAVSGTPINFAKNGQNSNWVGRQFPYITNDFTGTGNASGTYPAGVTNVTWTAMDANGSISTCTQMVNVEDVTAPTIICPSDMTDHTEPNTCTKYVMVPPPLLVMDDCTIGNALHLDGKEDCLQAPQGSDPFTIECWVKTDDSTAAIVSWGTDSCYQGVGLFIVNGKPCFVGGQCNNLYDTTEVNSQMWRHLAITYDASTVRIYVDSILRQTLGPITMNISGSRLHIGTWVDGNGNFREHYRGALDEIRIWNVPRTQSEIGANMGHEIEAQPGLITYYRFDQGEAADNNVGIKIAKASVGSDAKLNWFGLTGSISNFINGVPNLRDNFAKATNNKTGTANASAIYFGGSNSVVWTATDSSNNFAICTQRIEVIDSQPPVIICPLNDTVFADVDTCMGITRYHYPQVLLDNCTVCFLTLTNNAIPGDSAWFELGDTIITYEAKDQRGNSSSCSFMITVIDTMQPEFSDCSDTTVYTGINDCELIVDFPLPSADKNCSNYPLWVQILGDTSGSTFSVGKDSVAFAFFGDLGDTVYCGFNIIVEDTFPPEMHCRNFEIFLDTIGKAELPAHAIDNGSTDKCRGIFFQLDKSTFDCSDVGQNTVILSAFDNSGNKDTCWATVFVRDTFPPRIGCKNISVTLSQEGTVTIHPAHVLDAITDNCGSSTLSDSIEFGYPSGIVCDTAAYDDTLRISAPPDMAFDSVMFASYGNPIGACGYYSHGLCQDTIGIDRIESLVIGKNSVSIPVNYALFFPTCVPVRAFERLIVQAHYSHISPNRDSLTFNCTQSGYNRVILSVHDMNGNGSTCTAIVHVDTDTLQPDPCSLEEEDSLWIYPNPAHDHFWLEWNLPIYYAVTVTIFDFMGRQVYEPTQLLRSPQKIKFPTTYLAHGPYFVRVSWGNKVQVLKLIVRK